MFRRALLPIMAILIGSMILGSPQSAEAAFKLRISSDGGATFPIVVEDNVFVGSPDENPGVGIIAFTLPLGGAGNTLVFTINSNRTFGAPFARISEVDIASSGSSAVTLPVGFVFDVTDTSYAAPAGLSVLTSEASGTGFDGVNPSTASVTFQSWVDDANAEFGMPLAFTGGPQGPFVDTNFGGPSPPDTVMTLGSVAPPFSITSRYTIASGSIKAGGGFQLTGIAALTAVPEPATMVMLGMCAPVLGLGGLVRRFRGRKDA